MDLFSTFNLVDSGVANMGNDVQCKVVWNRHCLD